MKSLRNARGVTLLELLIVTGIIAMIAGLSVPTYKTVMNKTRRTRMFAQLRIMSEDQALYERDHGTFYPEGRRFGRGLYAFKIFRPDQPMLLEGAGATMPAGSRHYTYYIYRYEPYYPEPIIYAYAHRFWGNDLDGDSFPDLWIKVGSGRAQPYFDDLDNSWHRVVWR